MSASLRWCSFAAVIGGLTLAALATIARADHECPYPRTGPVVPEAYSDPRCRLHPTPQLSPRAQATATQPPARDTPAIRPTQPVLAPTPTPARGDESTSRSGLTDIEVEALLTGRLPTAKLPQGFDPLVNYALPGEVATARRAEPIQAQEKMGALARSALGDPTQPSTQQEAAIRLLERAALMAALEASDGEATFPSLRLAMPLLVELGMRGASDASYSRAAERLLALLAARDSSGWARRAR